MALVQLWPVWFSRASRLYEYKIRVGIKVSVRIGFSLGVSGVISCRVPDV